MSRQSKFRSHFFEKKHKKCKQQTKHFYLDESEEALNAKNQLFHMSQKPYNIDYELQIHGSKLIKDRQPGKRWSEKVSPKKFSRTSSRNSSRASSINSGKSSLEKGRCFKINRKLLKSASESGRNQTIQKIYEFEDDGLSSSKTKITCIRRQIKNNIVNICPFFSNTQRPTIESKAPTLRSKIDNKDSQSSIKQIRKGKWVNKKISNGIVSRVYEFIEEEKKNSLPYFVSQ